MAIDAAVLKFDRYELTEQLPDTTGLRVRTIAMMEHEGWKTVLDLVLYWPPERDTRSNYGKKSVTALDAWLAAHGLYRSMPREELLQFIEEEATPAQAPPEQPATPATELVSKQVTAEKIHRLAEDVGMYFTLISRSEVPPKERSAYFRAALRVLDAALDTYLSGVGQDDADLLFDWILSARQGTDGDIGRFDLGPALHRLDQMAERNSDKKPE